MVYRHVFACYISGKSLVGRRDSEMVHLHLIGQALELTVSALSTEHAAMVSLGKQELKYVLSGFNNPLVGCDHPHPFSNRHHAAGNESGSTVYFHHAEPTPPPIGEARMAAEGRDTNAVLLRCIQDCRTFIYNYLSIINFKIYLLIH
jgi:hypothetical protein